MQSWHWLRSLQMKSIYVEHHMVHSQTPILKPQNSCQQPRSRTPETSLCHRNRYLHHTRLIFFASKHIVSIPPCYDHSGVGSKSISRFAYWFEQFGGPFTFNLDPLVTLACDAIYRQPLARHTKIKEQLDKICRKSEPKAWCSYMTIKEPKFV